MINIQDHFSPTTFPVCIYCADKENSISQNGKLHRLRQEKKKKFLRIIKIIILLRNNYSIQQVDQ